MQVNAPDLYVCKLFAFSFLLFSEGICGKVYDKLNISKRLIEIAT